jgi:hypothetical protein
VTALLVFAPFEVQSAHYLLFNGPRHYDGELAVNGVDSVSTDIVGVVAGSGYTLLVTADAPDGSFHCSGSAGPFTVPIGFATTLAVGFRCETGETTRPPPESNEWTTNECPQIISATASPPIGCSIALHVSAVDGDRKPAPLSYSWSNGLAGPNPILMCGSRGPVDLMVTVSDGDSAAGCPAEHELQIICPPGCDGDLGAVDADTLDGSIEADAGSSPDGHTD